MGTHTSGAMISIRTATLLAVTALLLPAAALAPREQTAGDDAVRHARRVQDRFERVKRAYYPIDIMGPAGGPCDEVVGRICLRFGGPGGGRPLPPAPPEHDRVTRARTELLADLDSLGALAPADPWLIGQRVRYRLEADRDGDALAVLDTCAAADWWCAALAGLVHQSVGRHVEAERWFDDALATMTADERCAWEDLEPVLDARAARAWRGLGCEHRDSLAQRIWWLADPLYLVPGNDRRAEHYARRTLERLLDGGAIPYRMTWGNDLGSVLMRYGWPARFERSRPPPGLTGEDQIVGRFARPAWAFLPPDDVLAAPTEVAPGEWTVDRERARARYALPARTRFAWPEHQLARFERGDSALVVAAYDVTPHDIADTVRLDAGLFVRRDERTAGNFAVRRDAPPSGVLTLRAAAERAVVSLELAARNEPLAFRARYGVHLQRDDSALRISDLLVLRATDSLPARLDEAAPLARADARTAGSDTVWLYWEVYGVHHDAAAYTVALDLDREAGGILRRAGEWLGVVERAPPVRLRWQEQVLTDEGVRSHAAVLGLGNLPSGRYRLAVTVRAGPGSAQAARDVVVDR